MVYIIMFGQNIYEDIYYTDEKIVHNKVTKLNEIVKGVNVQYWVKTLQKP